MTAKPDYPTYSSASIMLPYDRATLPGADVALATAQERSSIKVDALVPKPPAALALTVYSATPDSFCMSHQTSSTAELNDALRRLERAVGPFADDRSQAAHANARASKPLA